MCVVLTTSAVVAFRPSTAERDYRKKTKYEIYRQTKVPHTISFGFAVLAANNVAERRAWRNK